MSQLSKLRHSRDQWKQKAKDRGDQSRYQRQQLARIKAERDRATEALKLAQSRLSPFDQERPRPPSPSKVDLVWIALQLIFVARLGFRAASRVLRLLAPALGLNKGPCAQTLINWVTRLAIVRLATVSRDQRPYLPTSPFSNGSIWMIDLS
jgi:hypothetical protein